MLTWRYGVIFWGSDPESKSIFKLQKRVIQLINDAERYTSYKELFKALNILPVPCFVYKWSSMLYKNKYR
jgi:hypothetical protein